jgi:hypothetical protein
VSACASQQALGLSVLANDIQEKQFHSIHREQIGQTNDSNNFSNHLQTKRIKQLRFIEGEPSYYVFIKDSIIPFLSSFDLRIRDFFPPESLHLAKANVWPTQTPFTACMMGKNPPPFSIQNLHDTQPNSEYQKDK